MQDAQTRIALVVEDDRISGIVLEDWLRGQGWQVERVENGTEGLRRFQELKPRLVLADVLLPGIDGVRLCSQIRLQPFGERVWIGLLSARASLRDSSLAAGADFFLGKPLPFPQLAAELERLAASKVRMRFSVDPSLIGGVTARVGSKVYDGSVRGQLAVLRQRLLVN